MRGECGIAQSQRCDALSQRYDFGDARVAILTLLTLTMLPPYRSCGVVIAKLPGQTCILRSSPTVIADILMPGCDPAGAGEQPLEPGQLSFKDCADCPEMVVIPAGSFAMGSPQAEPGAPDTDDPDGAGRAGGCPNRIENFQLGVRHEAERLLILLGVYRRCAKSCGHGGRGCALDCLPTTDAAWSSS